MPPVAPVAADDSKRFNAIVSLIVGVIILATLIGIFFFSPTLTNDQRALARFLIALAGALFAFFFTGSFGLSGNYQGFAIRAGAGFAVFFAVYFLVNPFEHAIKEEDHKEESNLGLIGATDARVLQVKATLKRLNRYHGPLDGEEDDELLAAVDKFKSDYEYLFGELTDEFKESVETFRETTTIAAPDAQNADIRADAQAIAWVALTPEFAASARGVYKAMINFVATAREPEFTALFPGEIVHPEAENLPPAVLMDIDSAVLDSSDFSARASVNGTGFILQEWESYVLMAASQAVPGSVEAAKELQSLGIKPIYLSMRTENLRQATLDNLQRLGFPVDPSGDNLFTRATGIRSSAQLRQLVSQEYRIISIVGDSMDDFMESPDELDERRRLADSVSSFWGGGWFVIPNPVFSRSLSWLMRSDDGAWLPFDQGEQRLMRSLGNAQH